MNVVLWRQGPWMTTSHIHWRVAFRFVHEKWLLTTQKLWGIDRAMKHRYDHVLCIYIPLKCSKSIKRFNIKLIDAGGEADKKTEKTIFFNTNIIQNKVGPRAEKHVQDYGKFKTWSERAPDKWLQTEGNIIRFGIPAVVWSDNRQQLHRDKSIYLDPQEAAQSGFHFPATQTDVHHLFTTPQVYLCSLTAPSSSLEGRHRWAERTNRHPLASERCTLGLLFFLFQHDEKGTRGLFSLRLDIEYCHRSVALK